MDQKRSTAELMKVYLRAERYSVDHTPNPEEALALAINAQYGVVITDLVMRGMTGIDLFRELRSQDVSARFVFLLTPSGEALKLMGSLEREDVIKKEPLSMNEVICKVRAAFAS